MLHRAPFPRSGGVLSPKEIKCGTPPVRRVTESHPVHIDELRALARARFGDMVKGVVDPTSIRTSEIPIGWNSTP
jgi:hypothetical protein